MALFSWAAHAQQPTVVQPFAGSDHVAQYAADFDRLTYRTQIEPEPKSEAMEGKFRAGVAIWPKDKSPLEVQRSFEKALEAAGFKILANVALPKFSEMQKSVKQIMTGNNTEKRGYPQISDPARNAFLDIQKVVVFPGHYISAVREDGETKTVFVLTLSTSQNRYLMEEISVAAMADDNVTISAEGLTSEIEDAGKAILYGIQFDTGSATIRPTSAASLETIAQVLKSREGQFYVVGHTDDTGGYEMNMKLSADRAASIVAALEKQYGIDTGRLLSSGVGPLAPLASNENDAGKQMNRRVELVERLDQ